MSNEMNIEVLATELRGLSGKLTATTIDSIDSDHLNLRNKTLNMG